MRYTSPFGKKLENLCRGFFPAKLASSTSYFKPFWVLLCYFLIVSLKGYFVLKLLNPRTVSKLDDLDLFFTSVSAATTSSMSTVEMEAFSNAQLIIITFIMFLGGEIHMSFLGLLIQRFRLLSAHDERQKNLPEIDFMHANSQTRSQGQMIELGTITVQQHPLERDKPLTFKPFSSGHEMELPYNSIKTLGYVVLGYFLIIHAVGSGLISAYISLTPSANNVLKRKGLVLHTFSIFTTVSTFTNCGFTPTNENMMVFNKNSGLLLILIPQVLLGDTLYAPCLRLVIHVLYRLTRKKEYKYILNNYQELGYGHLMSEERSWYLSGTILVFLMSQFVAFTAMEWNSGVMDGMNSLEKLIGSLFECVNSRHAGESIVDLSSVSSAILVLFVVMMYLPSNASFLPIGDQQEEASENRGGSKNTIVENIILCPLAYLAIFIFVICVTERKSMRDDPLNFSLLNIVVEVVSAYGNVGFSTGYSCKRRLKLDGQCEDKWFGFAGQWSKTGKSVLILVMIFGRLKKFTIHGRKPWILT
ncbi:hypothetical protein Cgig2_019418 [Carnegiea gigantea]|uniref:Sodium transporter HKT1 n=1 Tax=Carnegiea gigantea TaxID=171969 RepID=A0A9Q1KPQ1_9CARY|nr:hypothetical protein Cgig2_019418 [Carnegiea gigantea]